MNIGEFTITLECTIDHLNEWINMCNVPNQVPTVTWAKHIDWAQQQAAPQIAKLQADLAAVEKAGKKDEE